MTISRDQFLGSMLGIAVGDAVGAPWEGHRSDLIFEMGPASKIVEHSSGDTLYYTDDTQMTIGVLQTLIAHQCIDKNTLARQFAENYHPDRGYGQGARRIINAIGFGEDWETLAATLFNGEGSLGNGAAMRVAPLGLFFGHDLKKVDEQAALSAAPTHQHETGIDGARIMAVAAALAALTAGQRFRRKPFLEQLLSFAKTEEFQWQINHALQLEPNQSLIAFGNSIEAHRSVMTSIMCFIESPDDYSATIARAIGQGNDVDTLAAMAGALSGARLGISGIPSTLIQCLEDNHQGRTYLIDLADQLYNANQKLIKQS